MTTASASRTIDIADVIGRAPLGRLQWTIVIISALVIAVDGYDSLAVTFAAPALAKEMGQSIASFGPIFSASIFGLIIGSLLLGPIADRIGRKNLLLFSVAFFGIASLLPIVDFAYTHLIAYRFLTGLGLGAAMPAAIALTAEYVPVRQKTILVNLMFIGYPLGGVIGGLVAARLVPHFGWRSVFVLGGVTPLLLLPLMLAFVPESVALLATKGNAARARILATLRRLDASSHYTDADTFVVAREEQQSGLGSLFSSGRAAGTILLWIVFFLTLFIVTVMAFWLPAMMDRLGLPIERAIVTPAIFLGGGVIGALILGSVVDRRGAAKPLIGAFVLCACLLLGFSHLTGLIPLAFGVAFLIGMCGVGAQLTINALAARFYETKNRSTGVGWALGIGRFGSVAGPLTGALLFRPAIGLGGMLELVAAAAFLAALAIYVLGRLYPVVGSRGTG
jgi:AAHS family 4-hydroxybenzoate transporter-like MFS transporter